MYNVIAHVHGSSDSFSLCCPTASWSSGRERQGVWTVCLLQLPHGLSQYCQATHMSKTEVVHSTCFALFIYTCTCICHEPHFFYFSKEVIFTYTTTGKMMRRAPCEACHYVMQMVQDPDNISASTLHICSQCGEANVRIFVLIQTHSVLVS